MKPAANIYQPRLDPHPRHAAQQATTPANFTEYRLTRLTDEMGDIRAAIYRDRAPITEELASRYNQLETEITSLLAQQEAEG